MNIKEILITGWLWFPALATVYAVENETFVVCRSPECLRRAKLINESLDTTTDPCTDFYSYVCNGWERNHRSLISEGGYDVYQEIDKNIPERLSYILGNKTLVESNQTIIDKVGIMYNACLAFADGRGALNKVLNESGFNNWPIVTEENIFNSSNSTSLLRHISIRAILDVEVVNKKGNLYMIWIKPMPIQQEIMKRRDIREVMKNTIEFLEPGINSSMLDNLITELMQFAQNISNIMELSIIFEDKISSLEAKYPEIPLSYLLQKELGKVNITLNDKDTFHYWRYYKKISMFLRTAHPNTLYNYGGFLAIFPYIEYVQMSTKKELTSNEHTQTAMKSRTGRECIEILGKSVSDVLDYLYVNNETNHSEIKAQVEDIARRLKHAFNETFQNNRWIDNTTRIASEKKLKEVPLGIGYPNTLMNISLLQSRYEYVPSFPSDISFPVAMYYLKENSYKMGLRKLRHPEGANLGWEYTPRGDRPFHTTSWKKLEIPYTILSSPFFEQELPRSLNYGGIGITIAHQVALSFSIIGHYNDRLHRNTPLISPDARASYRNIIACFEKQYQEANRNLLEKYGGWSAVLPVAGETITLNNDVADNTALQGALKAYRKVLDEECAGVDTRLPGLENITGIQLFFIAGARTQCKIEDKMELRRQLERGGHSPTRNRVNEALKNMKEFATAFKCKIGSAMNPANNAKCSFW